MIQFIIPVKSQKIASSWENLSKLFDRCLRSVCQQTDQSFKVIVVCNEKPVTDFHHPNIHYHFVDFPPPAPEEDTGFKLIHSSKEADKAKKILAGLDFAKQFDLPYSMVVDADDCVSKNLVSFVKEHSNEPAGWFLNSGYFYSERSKFIFRRVKGFNSLCGTCMIIKPSMLKNIITPNLYFRHQTQAISEGMKLKPLPFPGAVYIMNNGENHFMTLKSIKHLNSGKTIKNKSRIKKIINLVNKVLNYRLGIVGDFHKRNFGLFKIPR